jgi:hypothetical protein
MKEQKLVYQASAYNPHKVSPVESDLLKKVSLKKKDKCILHGTHALQGIYMLSSKSSTVS